jgi:hypothetical protein
MRDDLQLGMLVEQPGKHDARHRDAGLIGPPKRPPDFVKRLLLARVIRHVGATIGMQPYWQIESGHGIEERQVLRSDQRLAADVREQLNAASSKMRDGAMCFVDCLFRIVQRQRSDEPGKSIGIFLHELGHPVVGPPSEIDRVIAAGEYFNRRRRDREHLLVALEAIHDAESLVQIDQHGASNPLAGIPEVPASSAN